MMTMKKMFFCVQEVVVVVLLVFSLISNYIFGVCDGHGISLEERAEDLSRINEYSLFSFKYDDDNGLLSFDAFGEKFLLSLDVNSDLIASNIRHGGDGIPDESLGHITSLTSSCHHIVKWISINNSKLSGSGGGISMCNKRGLRGFFWHDGESYTIIPSRYYLNNNDEIINEFGFEEEHMIWKESQFNTTGLERGEIQGLKMNEMNDDSDDSSSSSNNIFNNHRRKLSAVNGGKNYIEMGIICDSSFYTSFLSSYGSSLWYDELVGFSMDYVNQMTSEYYNTNWGSNIGKITIILREFEVFTSYSGIYASLLPNTVGTNDYDGGDYLRNLVSFLQNYKDMNDIDNYQLFTRLDLHSKDSNGNWVNIAGIAWLSTICRNKYYSCSVNEYYGNSNWFFKTISRELGHNLGMKNDQDTSCGNNAGIMGYGSGYDFSSCSIDFLNTYLYTNGYSSCLSDTGETFTTSGYNLDSINCITRQSSQSGTNDDATTSVSCPSGYTLTGCTGHTSWKNFDGWWSSGNTCYCRNGYGGKGCWAYARCCPISASCSNVRSSRSDSNDDDTAVSQCPAGSTLTGCSVDTKWKVLDGAHPGYNRNAGKFNPGKLLSTSNVCTGVTDGGQSVWSTARCCNSNNGYKLQCKQIWGSKSGTNDDAKSTVSCPSGYFMSGCTVFTHWGELDGAKFSTTGNTCYGYNGIGGGGVWAVGICCAQYSSNRRRRRLNLNEEPEYENVYESDCDGYKCFEMKGINMNDETRNYNILNGMWIEHGCHNEMAYYRLEQNGYKLDDDIVPIDTIEEYYIYFNIDTNTWNLFTSLDDDDSIAFCTEKDIIKCSGKWYFYINGHYEEETKSIVTMCNDKGDNNNDDSISNKINIYGDEIYICNNNNNTDVKYVDNNDELVGINKFTFAGYSNNGYALFSSDIIGGNIYYLHYVNYFAGSSIYFDLYVKRWVISKNKIEDIVGISYCESDYDKLKDTCVNGHWQIYHVESEFGDEAIFTPSESMTICNPI